MELCVFGRLTRALGAAILLLAIVSPMRNSLGAQRRQEFTQQGMLVSPFKSHDKKLGNHVADEIRGRVDKAANKRELVGPRVQARPGMRANGQPYRSGVSPLAAESAVSTIATSVTAPTTAA